MGNAVNNAYSRKGQPTGPPGVTGGRPPAGFGLLDAYRQAAQQRTGAGQGFRYDPNETDPRRTEGYWMNRGRVMGVPRGGAKGGSMAPPPSRPFVPPTAGSYGGQIAKPTGYVNRNQIMADALRRYNR